MTYSSKPAQILVQSFQDWAACSAVGIGDRDRSRSVLAVPSGLTTFLRTRQHQGIVTITNSPNALNILHVVRKSKSLQVSNQKTS